MASEWKPVKLGSLFEVKHGFAFKGEFFRNQPLLDVLLTPGNFKVGGGYKNDKLKYYDGPVPEDYILKAGDLIITMTDLSKEADTLGYPACVPKSKAHRFLHNQRLGKVILKPDVEIDQSFLYFLLCTKEYRHEIVAGATGTTVKHTSPSRILSYEANIPTDLHEQKAIAHILGTLDDKIELNRRMNETLEEMARAIFKSWFVDFDPVRVKADAKAKGTSPAKALARLGLTPKIAKLFPDAFQPSPLGPIPQGWTVGSIGDISDINSRTLKKNFDHKIIEYVDIASVSMGHLSGATKYELDSAPSRAKRLVKHGDIIWSCVRPNRKSYLLIDNPIENLVVSTGFVVMTPTRIPSSYLYLWTTNGNFVDYLTNNADGSAYPAVRADHFAKASIIIPEQAVLDRFHETVGELQSISAQNERESITLANIRDTLLPKLLSGEIRVKQAKKMVEEAV